VDARWKSKRRIKNNSCIHIYIYINARSEVLETYRLYSRRLKGLLEVDAGALLYSYTVPAPVSYIRASESIHHSVCFSLHRMVAKWNCYATLEEHIKRSMEVMRRVQSTCNQFGTTLTLFCCGKRQPHAPGVGIGLPVDMARSHSSRIPLFTRSMSRGDCVLVDLDDDTDECDTLSSRNKTSPSSQERLRSRT
jgi:hypothetical protein